MTTQTTTIDPSCTDDLPLGTLVNVAFDGRGLARITGHEDDGIHIITFLDDPQRTSEHVTAGESVGCTRADMTVVQLAAPEASDVETEDATALTFAVAADVTLTVTGRPGHWTVWSTDTADELVFAGKSDREKAHSAAIEVHDALVDERIHVAGLQDMARADREAAAALAARMQTTQGLWDALRATTVPATEPRTRGKRGGRGRRRGANAGSAAATDHDDGDEGVPDDDGHAREVGGEAARPPRRAQARRPAGRRGRGGAEDRVAGARAPFHAAAAPHPPRDGRGGGLDGDRDGRRGGRDGAAVPDAAATVAVTAAAVATARAGTDDDQAARRNADARRPGPAGRRPAATTRSPRRSGRCTRRSTSSAACPRTSSGASARSATRCRRRCARVLGDREAGRVRKAMRAGGLITGPTVIQEPAPRALRIACAPLRPSDAQRLLALADTEISMGVKASVDEKTAGTKARPLASR